ncbi:hypothetical protein MtrunA17_Chr6g0462331 [Medicago truncatula]|uniref:Putative plant transposon protein domain-containing protein n=1 Tax=Medicago truncatula TaxID=3880 RepID=A0A072UIN5_MEDTR|nr:uncharacterized protein LOC25495935 [Medicago truncatula]KEH25675.1 hypothetical protein MTR_6g033460 [Medicago truncatula]RHN50876.1 hypothetical protein MtrunA17_Chr6g0462331 [Medicago truncatula]
MGPKKTNTSSRAASKKQKTVASSSRSRVQEPFDSLRFKGPYQQQRYKDLLERTFWSEKVFQIKKNGQYRGIAQIICTRKWEILVNPPTLLNYDIIREFYANSIPTDPDEDFSFTTFVRGRTIRFDRNAINAYLGNPLNLPDNQLCAFHEKQTKGDWNHEEIAQGIFREGKTYERNPNGQPIKAHKHDMNTPAQVILHLILHNIRPKSHTSSTTLDVTPLLYYILANEQVDIARVISQEMKIVAESGIKPPAKHNCPLTFPGLIIGLCHKARIVIPAQVHETIKHPITDTYIGRYCTGSRARARAEAPQTQSTPQEAQPAPTPQQFLFSEWDPRYLAAYTYTWDQNEANHRALNTIQDSMYRLQLQFGVPQALTHQLMTPDAFQAHVAWPGVRPFYPGGTSAAVAKSSDEEEGEEGEEGNEDDGEEGGSNDVGDTGSEEASDAMESD